MKRETILVITLLYRKFCTFDNNSRFPVISIYTSNTRESVNERIRVTNQKVRFAHEILIYSMAFGNVSDNRNSQSLDEKDTWSMERQYWTCKMVGEQSENSLQQMWIQSILAATVEMATASIYRRFPMTFQYVHTWHCLWVHHAFWPLIDVICYHSSITYWFKPTIICLIIGFWSPENGFQAFLSLSIWIWISDIFTAICHNFSTQIWNIKSHLAFKTLHHSISPLNLHCFIAQFMMWREVVRTNYDKCE